MSYKLMTARVEFETSSLLKPLSQLDIVRPEGLKRVNRIVGWIKQPSQRHHIVQAEPLSSPSRAAAHHVAPGMLRHDSGSGTDVAGPLGHESSVEAVVQDEVRFVSAASGVVGDVEARAYGNATALCESELQVSEEYFVGEVRDALEPGLCWGIEMYSVRVQGLRLRGDVGSNIQGFADVDVDSEAGLLEVDGEILLACLSADSR